MNKKPDSKNAPYKPAALVSKQCYFCNNGVKSVDYKEVETLRKFLNPHARIQSKRHTGMCAKHARQVALAIKRARFLGLLPYTSR